MDGMVRQLAIDHGGGGKNRFFRFCEFIFGA
jgi:hypothetical protein